MTETVYLRGEGGVVWEMNLPLPHGVNQRLARGDLQVVDADGHPIAVEPAADPEDAKVDPNARPAKNASQAAWVDYAVNVHEVPVDEADAMTRADLIEMFGQD